MSFTPRFAPDAESQWHELDFELQELVLDEMEKLAADPPRTVRGLARHDFVLDRPGERHYIFLRLAIGCEIALAPPVATLLGSSGVECNGTCKSCAER